ncbi:unnamed protein product [Paramecium sonneborni]|uniref:Uncharacterized protein n=1 Tax=Paramecium sonneborni TaxID=65129 RepID=A0A8S1RI60_9CILI|nr:unnamed protein product [Paramecium sonneborni]
MNRLNCKYQQNQQQYTQYYQESQKKCHEFRQYVYEDLQILINLIYGRNAILEHFKNDPYHPIVSRMNNKILLYLNQSNTIHLGLQQQYQRDSYLSKFLIQERLIAYRILKNVINFNDIEMNSSNQNSSRIIRNNEIEEEYVNNEDSIQTALIEYSNDYQNGNFKMNKYKLQETGLVAKSEESDLIKRISAEFTIDSRANSLRNGQSYDTPLECDILKTAKQFQNKVRDKLKQNFHQINTGGSQIKNNNTEEETIQNEFIKFQQFYKNGIDNKQQMDQFIQEYQNLIHVLLSDYQYEQYLKQIQDLRLSGNNLFYDHYQLFYFFRLFTAEHNTKKPEINHIIYFFNYLEQIKKNKISIQREKPEELFSEKYNYQFYQEFKKCYKME